MNEEAIRPVLQADTLKYFIINHLNKSPSGYLYQFEQSMVAITYYKKGHQKLLGRYQCDSISVSDLSDQLGASETRILNFFKLTVHREQLY